MRQCFVGMDPTQKAGAIGLCAIMASAFVVSITMAVAFGPPPEWHPQKKPIITGPTNYGTLTHNGTVLQLRGHVGWEAQGSVRKDGSVILVWTQLSSGDLAIGVYAVQGDGSLSGHWGWITTAKIEEDGSISNWSGSETIFQVAPRED